MVNIYHQGIYFDANYTHFINSIKINQTNVLNIFLVYLPNVCYLFLPTIDQSTNNLSNNLIINVLLYCK